MTKIAFISAMAILPWGGSEELWSQAALRLREEGHEVSACVPWWPKLWGRVEELRSKGIRIWARKSGPQLPLAARLTSKVLLSLGWAGAESRWLRDRAPDLAVISQGGNADGAHWMETCGRLQVPYATVVQCNSESWWPDDRSAAALANSYRGARRVFCVSRHNLGLLERQLGEPLTNAEVIWNPWGVAGGEPPPAPEGTDSINMACVARLDPNAKGQDILFEVLAQPVWRERRVFLNLYGGGPCEQSLRKLAQGMDLKNIAFHGHVADIRGVWQANHLLVLPSRFEGLPLSLVEAMWCARPAVVTDVGGCAEACVDGETGFVAAAPTAHSFGEALERAWQSRTRLRMMGLAARKRIEEIFPPDPVGEFCERVKNIVSQGRRNKATS